MPCYPPSSCLGRCQNRTRYLTLGTSAAHAKPCSLGLPRCASHANWSAVCALFRVVLRSLVPLSAYHSCVEYYNQHQMIFWTLFWWLFLGWHQPYNMPQDFAFKLVHGSARILCGATAINTDYMIHQLRPAHWAYLAVHSASWSALVRLASQVLAYGVMSKPIRELPNESIIVHHAEASHMAKQSDGACMSLAAPSCLCFTGFSCS